MLVSRPFGVLQTLWTDGAAKVESHLVPNPSLDRIRNILRSYLVLDASNIKQCQYQDINPSNWNTYDQDLEMKKDLKYEMKYEKRISSARGRAKGRRKMEGRKEGREEEDRMLACNPTTQQTKNEMNMEYGSKNFDCVY
jgi:hypothetical protein